MNFRKHRSLGLSAFIAFVAACQGAMLLGILYAALIAEDVKEFVIP